VKELLIIVLLVALEKLQYRENVEFVIHNVKHAQLVLIYVLLAKKGKLY
jgi:hypothetical protein